MNKHKLWTQSVTSSYLTSYAEGIACVTFDRRKEYVAFHLDKTSFAVVHNNVFLSQEDDIINQNYCLPITKFDRVRTVKLNEKGFMTCSCGFVHQYLMPCVHIACVIDDVKYFTPSLFHLRWWKTFNLFYKNKEMSNNKEGFQYKSSNEAEITLNFIRDHHYNKHDGSYYGVPISNELFNVLSSKTIEEINTGDNQQLSCKLNKIQAMVNMDLKSVPLKKGSSDYKNFVFSSSARDREVSTPTDKEETTFDCSSSDNNSFSEFDNLATSSQPCNSTLKNLNSFGGLSQMSASLSQQRSLLDYSTPVEAGNDYMQKNVIEETSAYNQLVPFLRSL